MSRSSLGREEGKGTSDGMITVVQDSAAWETQNIHQECSDSSVAGETGVQTQ